MKIDLDGLSKPELQKLKADVEKALAAFDEKKRAEARKAAEDAVRKFGFSLDEVVGRPRGRAAAGGVPKFRNPANPKQTWTGRGRQPGWIKEGLARGAKLADFAI